MVTCIYNLAESAFKLDSMAIQSKITEITNCSVSIKIVNTSVFQLGEKIMLYVFKETKYIKYLFYTLYILK